MSRIVIIGGHGKISRILTSQLVENGDEVVSVFRNPDHSSEIAALGAEPVVCDIETASVDDLVPVITGADAVVFAAGAGPGSGAARKDTVDRAAAVLLAEAAEQAGAGRFLQVSSGGLDAVRDGNRPADLDEVMYAYLLAKLAAEDDLMARSSLDWTIVRPGILTNDAPTGLVQLAPDVRRDTVPRADVAAVLAELLRTGNGIHQAVGLISGPTPVADAVQALEH